MIWTNESGPLWWFSPVEIFSTENISVSEETLLVQLFVAVVTADTVNVPLFVQHRQQESLQDRFTTAVAAGQRHHGDSAVWKLWKLWYLKSLKVSQCYSLNLGWPELCSVWGMSQQPQQHDRITEPRQTTRSIASSELQLPSCWKFNLILMFLQCWSYNILFVSVLCSDTLTATTSTTLLVSLKLLSCTLTSLRTF